MRRPSQSTLATQALASRIHAHAAMRAEGRIPGDEGRAVIHANRETRKFSRQMEQRYGHEWRVGQANMDGI
jgi:hypothetical protein